MDRRREFSLTITTQKWPQTFFELNGWTELLYNPVCGKKITQSCKHPPLDSEN